MTTVPCPLCGYSAPRIGPCPHCRNEPLERSLCRRLANPLTGILDGFLAVPMGLWFLMTTGKVKRWLVPPLLLTTAILITALWWTFTTVSGLLDSALPDSFEFGAWNWIEGLSERWSWLQASWAAAVTGSEWLVNAAWGFLISQPLRVVTWFLLGSLVLWYCFSIAYEAFAGPFLDEVQARLEIRWFGNDPRNRLERPNDIPVDRCMKLTTLASLGAAFLFLLLWFLPGVPGWAALLLSPLALLPAILRDRRYGEWLRWVAKVEGKATWASIQAAIITGILLVVALPLYFVPVVGYFLFATVAGFATAVGLLDIPMERRLWKLGQRARFIGRNLPPLIAFGVAAGLLLAIPILGPLLMVPSASLGGLWLICRLDKSHLAPREAAPGNASPSDPPGLG
jgi:uncharacterized protein involved in cysteine biosynthesis